MDCRNMIWPCYTVHVQGTKRSYPFIIVSEANIQLSHVAQYGTCYHSIDSQEPLFGEFVSTKDIHIGYGVLYRHRAHPSWHDI